jgi:hypothetical protein
MSSGRRGGFLRAILGLLLIGAAIVYGAAALTSPWSFHIGGRWTPLLYWSGTGKLVTKNGIYPLYVSFFPSSHFSRLRLEGLRPTGGLQGSAMLCTTPGSLQKLKVSGTIYGGWKSTEGSLMAFRFLEFRIFNHQREGYFDLYGRWRGPQLLMEDRGEQGIPFPSGLSIEHASVVLDWGDYSDFKRMCTNAASSLSKPSSSKHFP